MDARGALDLYKQMTAEAVTLSPYIFRVIINVCVKAEQSTDLKAEAFQVYEDMKADAVFSKGIDESIYSALLKLCSKEHDFERCQALIAEIEEKQMATKLRTFAPLLQAYSEVGDLANCIAVKSKIEGHEIELTEPEYLALLKVCTANKDAAQFYAILEEYIDAIAQPDPAAWDVLKDWFSRCAFTSLQRLSFAALACHSIHSRSFDVARLLKSTARSGSAAPERWTKRAFARRRGSS